MTSDVTTDLVLLIYLALIGSLIGIPPHLQLDLNGHQPVAAQQELAGEMSATYARMMLVDIQRISAPFREFGDGNVGRVADSGGDQAPPVAATAFFCSKCSIAKTFGSAQKLLGLRANPGVATLVEASLSTREFEWISRRPRV